MTTPVRCGTCRARRPRRVSVSLPAHTRATLTALAFVRGVSRAAIVQEATEALLSSRHALERRDVSAVRAIVERVDP